MASAVPGTVSRVVATGLLFACTGSSGGWTAAGDPDMPTVVQFSYDAVTPAAVTIAGDGNGTWENTASDTRGYVVFPASITSSFRCTDFEPYFAKTPQGLRSQPIIDVESARVRLPCSLAPGSYDYEIWLVGEGLGTGSDDATPEQVLRAKIVVK